MAGTTNRGWRGPVHIENEAAYAEARARNIKRNATKGRSDRWHAGDATRAALVQEIAKRSNGANFFGKMLDAIEEWGALTDGQEAACRRIIEQDAAKKAEFKARDAASNFVGEIDARSEYVLTVSFLTSFETNYGHTYVTGTRDAAGNVIIIKGSKQLRIETQRTLADIVEDAGLTTRTTPRIERLPLKGDRITVKATVKEHKTREGVKQTILTRVKLLAIEARPEAAPAPVAAPAAPAAPIGWHVMCDRANGTTDQYPVLFTTKAEANECRDRLEDGDARVFAGFYNVHACDRLYVAAQY